MRDLEKQIADWRRTMAKTSSSEAVEELEAHLREEIDRLHRAGTPKDAAFATALSNIGSPSALAAEFDKLALAGRAKWKPVTIAQWLCIAAALGFAVLLISRIGHGRMTLLLASHVLPVTVGYGMMFIIGGLGICHVLACWLQQSGPRQRNVFRRATFKLATIAGVLTAIGLVIGMFWAKENWGRYWTWDPKENGALLVIGWAMMTSALICFKPTHYNMIAIMSIVGNICTAWAWFGTAGTVSRDGHVIAGMHATPLLLAFTVSHCIVLCGIPLMRFRSRSAIT
jgi:hypothetical protein